MPGEYKEDKTEPATQRQRERARERGNVAQSHEVSSVFLLVFGLLTLYFCSSFMVNGMKDALTTYLSNMSVHSISLGEFNAGITKSILKTLLIISPLLIAVIVISLAASYVQFGFLFTAHTLKPKFSALKPTLEKLNPFAKDKLVNLGISLLKIGIITIMTYKTMKNEIPNLMKIADTSVPCIFNFAAMLAFRLILKIGILFIIAAVADFIYRKYKHEESIKMTKQQVKDERKDLEGDPMIKGKIRSIQIKTAMKRMMKEVPKADVVITNPTHYAVALRYDKETMWAPKVVAKGARLIAEKIKEIARENNIPLVENKPLAQALFKVAEVGKYIPVAFYHAVAEILAYIYNLKLHKVSA